MDLERQEPEYRSHHNGCTIGLTIRGSNTGKRRDFYLLQDVQPGSEAQSASCSMGIWAVSRGQSSWDVNFTTQIHLASRLRMSGAVLLFAPHAFTAWTGTDLLLYFCS